MAANFEEVIEIIFEMRKNLEDSSLEHFERLEDHLNSRSNGFLCSFCLNKFTRPDNRRRHCRKKHGLLICEFSNCKRTFFNRWELDFHQAEDIHYCVVCIKHHQGRHRCPPRRNYSAPNTSFGDLDLSSIIQLGSPHSIRTASPMSSPELLQRSPPLDLHWCCIEPDMIYGEEVIRLDPNVSGRAIAIMALAVTFALNGPEKITSKIIDDIVKNGIRYDSWYRERKGPDENLQQPHAIVLSSPYDSVTYIQINEDWTGDFVFDSFKDSFEFFCLKGRYGLCTVADESVALILTEQTLHVFTLELDFEYEVMCQRHPCVMTHSRESCLPMFLFDYFTRSLLEAKSASDESSYNCLSDHKFSFHILDLELQDAFVM